MNYVIGIPLFLGVVLILLSSIALVILPTAYARLHFLAPTTLGIFLIVISILIKEGLNQQGIKSLLVFIILMLIGPVLTHATARAGKMEKNQ
ncbi:cation:proton antiporter [Legionella cincinnatiensis]|uniref:Monovalent cation/H+ antiporter subunit G n=1 Tax=Legionella cincinnatiensis TaxID=28085 RepID=A0A378IH31_9GAMM|nr:monovalent cation/H(+) antiporter subunit G [Legionella cincinnatiensis]KTC92626.1 putative monovalent cation/H+ antiporter subunit G [Legionella cincinnatiensis]STX34240.1 putative monovalent cation/H+ antiporter subunit G [Legionella cincinnatiensis]